MSAPLPQHASFSATKKITDTAFGPPPAVLWKILSFGLEKTLWQHPENPQTYPLSIGTCSPKTNEAPAIVSLNCQGLQSTLEGKLTQKKSADQITWQGCLFNGRDGLIEFLLTLSIKDCSKKNASNTEKQTIQVTLNLQILQQKGRIALLDPRKMFSFWQDVIENLLTNQITMIQKIQKNYQIQPSFVEKYHLKKYRLYFIFIIIALLLFLLFSA